MLKKSCNMLMLVFLLSALFIGKSSSDLVDRLRQESIINNANINISEIDWDSFMHILENFTRPTPNIDFTDFIKRLNISKDCYEAYIFSSRETKIKFFDAGSKISNGILAANAFDIGNYDECINIQENVDNFDPIYGKYCLTTFQLPLEFIIGQLDRKPRTLSGSTNFGLHYAYCSPSQCTGNDLEKILNGVIKIINENFTNPFVVDRNYCYSNAFDNSLSFGAILTLVLLAFFSGLVFISTTYDIYLRLSHSLCKQKVLLAFSFLTNGEKIFKVNKGNADSILCLNGIKAISMMWVIISHEYLLMPLGGIDNFTDAFQIISSKVNMFITNGTLSVDSFFMVGGLVTMYVFLKAYDKGVRFNLFMFYLHRYLRLTPALAVLVPVHIYLMQYFASGPFWGGVNEIFVRPCKEHWWANLLYVQNFNNPTENCVPQSWYLSVDMQLFILSPIILLPSVKWPSYRKLILFFFISLGILVPFSVSYYYRITSNFVDMKPTSNREEYMPKYYMQTHTRFGPYVIGMFFGNLIYTAQMNKKRPNNEVVAILWPICLAILVGCVYGPADLFTSSEFDKLPHAFVNGFYRNGWAVGLGILIYLCTVGCGGPINTFLSLPIFQILTKLSYTMYLLHYMAIGIHWAASRTTIHFTHVYIMYIFWADFMVIFFASLIYCLTFESPIIVLEKYLLESTKKSSRHKSEQENNNNISSNNKTTTTSIA